MEKLRSELLAIEVCEKELRKYFTLSNGPSKCVIVRADALNALAEWRCHVEAELSARERAVIESERKIDVRTGAESNPARARKGGVLADVEKGGVRWVYESGAESNPARAGEGEGVKPCLYCAVDFVPCVAGGRVCENCLAGCGVKDGRPDPSSLSDRHNSTFSGE